MGRETRDCGGCRAGLIRAGVGTGYDLQFILGFKNFLYNSVKNASLDYLKHKEVEGKYVRYTLRTSETELEVMKDEVYRRLYQVLDELPKRCQEVFKYCLEGKKNSEIAEILQISELTVKTQKRNAIVYLRKRLGRVYMLYVLFKVGFM